MKAGKVFLRFIAEDGSAIVLRPLEKGDLTELLRFANNLVLERKENPDLGIVSLYRKVSRADERKFLSRVLLAMKRREAVSVAAFVGGRLVGNCDVSRREMPDFRHSGVLGMAILSEYRGIGLGTMMIRLALRESFRMGVWLVELQVFETNAAAVRLYEKVGFKKVGIVPNKILREGRLTNEIRMYADLREIRKAASRVLTGK